jgi:NAD(P)-dependent dehydrogenase (short-subunit alcohol dehydrogenase family)
MKFTQGEVAIVTGASRGIGRATAVELAKEGCIVIINYKSNASEAEKTLELIGNKRGITIQTDVTKEEDVKRLVAETMKQYGRIDILVNNAGEIIRPGDWAGDIAVWQKTIDANLTSVWLMIREVAPIMQKAGKGSIVNLTSTVGMLGVAPVMAYSAAKSGLLAVTKGMAKQLASGGIRVNAVAPSNVMTDMTRGAGQELIDRMKTITPIGRIATAEELAKPIVFLASDDASYITGHILVVDGGYSLK